MKSNSTTSSARRGMPLGTRHRSAHAHVAPRFVIRAHAIGQSSSFPLDACFTLKPLPMSQKPARLPARPTSRLSPWPHHRAPSFDQLVNVALDTPAPLLASGPFILTPLVRSLSFSLL